MGLFQKKKRLGTIKNISHFKSPYFGQPAFPSSRLKNRKKEGKLHIPAAPLKGPFKIKRAFSLLLVLLIIIATVYLTVFSTFFNLKTFEVKIDEIVTTDSKIEEILRAKKGENLIFIDEKKLAEQIQTIYPNIKSIKIKKLFPTKLKVEFEKYAVIANLINMIDNVQKKFLIDEIGFLTDENTENHELPYIIIHTSKALKVKTSPIEQEKLEYIMKAIKLFEEKFNMRIIDAEYKIVEREIHLRTEKYFNVWILMEKDLESQLNKIKKVQSRLDIYTTPLEYIDLRVSGAGNEKVIFKRR